MTIKEAIKIKIGDQVIDKTTGRKFTVRKIETHGISYGHKKPNLLLFYDYKDNQHWHRHCASVKE